MNFLLFHFCKSIQDNWRVPVIITSLAMGFMFVGTSCNGYSQSITDGTFDTYYLNHKVPLEKTLESEQYSIKMDEPCLNSVDCGWELNEY